MNFLYLLLTLHQIVVDDGIRKNHIAVVERG